MSLQIVNIASRWDVCQYFSNNQINLVYISIKLIAHFYALVSDSNTTSGKAIPLCLPNDCVWDKKSKTYTIKQIERNSLVINEEAVKILEGITNPICVIVVVGPYRSGKSYLLNQLIPSKESVFELGHTMVSKTKGIWMWDTPFQHTLKSGKKVTIILLDTEGVDAIESGTRGDTQVFTLSVLLSSLLVYNSTQVSKRENLNQMTYPIIFDAFVERQQYCRNVTLSVIDRVHCYTMIYMFMHSTIIGEVNIVFSFSVQSIVS